MAMGRGVEWEKCEVHRDSPVAGTGGRALTDWWLARGWRLVRLCRVRGAAWQSG